jgi:hypothetical protein
MPVALNGSTSGSVTLTAPAVAGTTTLTFPATTGTINTSGTVNEVPAGSAAAPSIYSTGDTNTGIFFPAADTIAFAEGGAEAMRINSSGNVGIGETNPTRKLDVAGTAAATYFMMTSNTASAPAVDAAITRPADGTLALITNSAERMRIDSSGIVTGTAGNLMLISGTSVASTSGTAITFTGIPSWVKRITVMLSNVSTSGTSFLQAQIGSTTFTTSGYVSTSAYTGPASGGTTATSGFLLETAHTAANSFTGSAVIVNITGNTWVYTSTMARNDGYVMLGGGVLALGGVLDRVRVTTVNGTDTFDAGSINILYE